eukprot:353614-Chlamydomonas_euryale.AAC.4
MYTPARGGRKARVAALGAAVETGRHVLAAGWRRAVSPVSRTSSPSANGTRRAAAAPRWRRAPFRQPTAVDDAHDDTHETACGHAPPVGPGGPQCHAKQPRSIWQTKRALKNEGAAEKRASSSGFGLVAQTCPRAADRAPTPEARARRANAVLASASPSARAATLVAPRPAAAAPTRPCVPPVFEA